MLPSEGTLASIRSDARWWRLRNRAIVPAMNFRPAHSPFVAAKMSLTRLALALRFSVAALAGNPAVRAQTATAASPQLRRGDQHFLRDLIERAGQHLAAAKVAQSDASDPRSASSPPAGPTATRISTGT